MNKSGAIWAKWNPKAYLNDFYSKVEPDEVATIAFLAKIAKRIPQRQKILEFGTGPTLHHIFPFIPSASEVHLADFLKPNLEEISRWAHSKKDAHNWDSFISYTLRCEGNKNPTLKDIKIRKLETSNKITKYIRADAGQADPLGKRVRESYPVVISCYCADSATDNHYDFKRYVKNIASLTEHGGIFILACLRKARYYRVGALSFPSANVDEHLVRKILNADFIPKSIKIEVKSLPSHKEQGYTSIILAYATKRKSK